ncbi:MAG TPA: MotA/TolQ/ExbB proton channel family protein [Rhodothermales bacterium]|nr:MotA/TolQ/ExbB proton channel family protein [Rhodothermales bacterium]
MTPLLLLLQTAVDSLVPVDTLARAAATPLAPPPETTMLDLLIKGGWTMIPIFLLSFLALGIFIERLLALRKAHADPGRLTQTVAEYVRAGDLAGAVGYSRAQDSPAARIIQHGLERVGRPLPEIREAVETQGKRETYDLEKHTDLLASAAALAPMLGFLGTVTGLIRAFQAIQYAQGSVSPALLANGMWEAMITTATGLIVGIPALFMYNFLMNRIRRTVHDLERASTDFLDLLQMPAR